MNENSLSRILTSNDMDLPIYHIGRVVAQPRFGFGIYLRLGLSVCAFGGNQGAPFVVADSDSASVHGPWFQTHPLA
jgi:hypothetical protein